MIKMPASNSRSPLIRSLDRKARYLLGLACVMRYLARQFKEVDIAFGIVSTLQNIKFVKGCKNKKFMLNNSCFHNYNVYNFIVLQGIKVLTALYKVLYNVRCFE